MSRSKATKPPSASGRDALLATLRTRFEKHPARHRGIDWSQVEARLKDNAAALRSLQEMEQTGGEPDVIARDAKSGEITFVDCSPQSPAGRASLCYDQEALNARKEAKPKGSAVGLADEMGVELLTEDEYHELQKIGEFDTKSSSWLKTPAPLRKLGGAIFGDRRYDRVFIYHNGAQSYYSGRGFRAKLKV